MVISPSHIRQYLMFGKREAMSMLMTVLLLASLFPLAFPLRLTQVQADATTMIIPYLATGYKYKVVAFDEEPGFEQPGYDDSEFSTGDAGFGTQAGFCPLNTLGNAKTPWPLFTDILLRKEFTLPAGASNLKVGVAIDNDIQVFVNGEDISGGLVVHENCPTRDSFVFTAPDSILNDGENLLAIRAKDRGVLSYVDVKVTAVTGEPGAQYNIELFENGNPSDLSVNINQEVKAVADTIDPEVTEVTFRWIDPNTDVNQTTVSPISGGSAEDTFAPDEAGLWTVQADFGNGVVLQKTLGVSFFVLPESPIGALATIGSMLAVLGVFVRMGSRKIRNR